MSKIPRRSGPWDLGQGILQWDGLESLLNHHSYRELLDSLRRVGACFPADQDGSWTPKNKGKGVEDKKQEEAESQPVSGKGPSPTESKMWADSPWVSFYCQLPHTLGRDLADGVRKQRKVSLHPHRHGNLTLPPDPQNTPGSFPGQKPSVVWEVLGLGYPRVKMRKEREGRIPLKGKREKSLILLDNGG